MTKLEEILQGIRDALDALVVDARKRDAFERAAIVADQEAEARRFQQGEEMKEALAHMSAQVAESELRSERQFNQLREDMQGYQKRLASLEMPSPKKEEPS